LTNASAGVPLPSFFLYFLSYFVIAGLDPAIHAAKGLEQNLNWLTSLHVSMDHRVKPGGDEGIRLFDNMDRQSSDAQARPRERCRSFGSLTDRRPIPFTIPPESAATLLI
jgi:hypothetical protein